MRVSSNISFEIGIAALNRQQAAQVKDFVDQLRGGAQLVMGKQRTARTDAFRESRSLCPGT